MASSATGSAQCRMVSPAPFRSFGNEVLRVSCTHIHNAGKALLFRRMSRDPVSRKDVSAESRGALERRLDSYLCPTQSPPVNLNLSKEPMEIDLSPETLAGLRESAARMGLTLETYARRILEEHVDNPDGLPQEDGLYKGELEGVESIERTWLRRRQKPTFSTKRTAAAVNEIRQLRRDVILGSNLTIRNVIENGRKRSGSK